MLRSRIALVAVLAAGALSAAAAEAPAVLQLNSTPPPSYALTVPADLYEIWTFFNGPLAPLPAGAARVAGTMSGPHTGEVARPDNVIIFRNQFEPYFPGEMVVVSYHRDIQNTSGEPLTGGRIFAFTVASGAGSLDWSARQGWGAADIHYFI
jgi:hypothetical protein